MVYITKQNSNLHYGGQITSNEGETQKEKFISVYNQAFEKFHNYRSTIFVATIAGHDFYGSLFIQREMIAYNHSAIWVIREISDEIRVTRIELFNVT